eukprot:g38161.t1
MMHLILNTLPQEAIDQIADMVNMDPKTGKISGRQWENNDEQYFYLPLLHTWLNGMDLDLSTLRGDLEIRFYPRGSIFVAAQSAVNGQSAPAVPCTASLSEIRFITGCTQLPNGMRLGRSPLKQGKVAEQKYIDFVQYTPYAQRIKPSDRLAIDLDQFSHHSGGLFVFIRKSGDQTAYGDATTYHPQYTYDNTGRLMTYDMLGDATTIDLDDVHGRSQMGEGTPIDERFFREETMGQLVRSSYLKSNGVYMIPFSNDPKAMLDGVMDGYKTFVGNRERLVINAGPAPRAATVTYKYVAWYANTAVFALNDTNRLTVDFKGVTVAVLDIDSDLTFARITDRRYTSPATAALTNLNTLLASSSWLRACGVKIKFSNTRVGATNTVDWEASAAMEYTASVTDLNDQPVLWSRGDVHQAPDTSAATYNAQEEMHPPPSEDCPTLYPPHPPRAARLNKLSSRRNSKGLYKLKCDELDSKTSHLASTNSMANIRTLQTRRLYTNTHLNTDLGPSDHQKDWLPSLDNECDRFHVSSLPFKAPLDKPLQRVFTTQACKLDLSRPMLQARSVESYGRADVTFFTINAMPDKVSFRQASVADSVRKKYHNFPTHAQLHALENGVLFRYCSKAKDWLQEGFSRKAQEEEEGDKEAGKKKEEEDKKEAERKKKEEEAKEEAGKKKEEEKEEARKKKEEEEKEEARKKKEEEEKEEARKKKEEEEKEEARKQKEEDKKEAERKKKEEEDEEEARKKKGEEEKKKEEPEEKKEEEDEEKKKPEGKKKEEEKEKEEKEGKELDLTSLDAADDPDQRRMETLRRSHQSNLVMFV